MRSNKKEQWDIKREQHDKMEIFQPDDVLNRFMEVLK
jgi:hypothetical protein